MREDEGVRPGTSVAKLSKLRPSFTEDGTTTAGNSSQVPTQHAHRARHTMAQQRTFGVEWEGERGKPGKGAMVGGFWGPRPHMDMAARGLDGLLR